MKKQPGGFTLKTNDFSASPGFLKVQQLLAEKGRKPFQFQVEKWQAISARQSGLVNAPTGFGKTFSVFLGVLIRYINENPENYLQRRNNGIRLLWVTPLRALAKDIARAMEEVITDLKLPWKVGIRNGDTTQSERQKQKRLTVAFPTFIVGINPF